jgi:hypothetical protein
MAVPLLAWGAVALAGAFVGSQIDDAVESPTTQNTSANARITAFDLAKYGALAGGALVLYGMARKRGILK